MAYVGDTEIYGNFFLAAFKHIESGKVVSFEMAAGEELDCDRLERFLRRNRVIGFNWINFDLPLLAVALAGASTKKLKRVANDIIQNRMKPWDIERAYDVRIPKTDFIDLIEVAPGQASLKIYGGRIHAPRMQDLPVEHDALLTPKQMDVVHDYCVNDLDTTALLFRKLQPQIELREKMSEQYGIDLRSKSDAQIAEAVIKSGVEKLLGAKPMRPEIPPGTSFTYRVPPFIKFTGDDLNDILDEVRRSKFKIDKNGKVTMPKALEQAAIKIGRGVYRMGIGGLHSSETCAAHVSDDEHILIDRDVASYYPAIIINNDLYPKHLGWAFMRVYKKIVDRRLKAKRDGDKVTADSLKITINGSFGKFGSKWSALYSPDLLIQTTLTGQLSLLMFIERLEHAGIPVVSANTDGIVIKCPRRLQGKMDAIVKQWESDTAFETEATEYAALYSRDVNNYIAVKPDGKTKTKGAYADAGLMKNPTNAICIEAVTAHITKGTPLGETIRACRDITKFVTIRSVTGGAVWRDEYLGKAIRFYYGKGIEGAIHYKENGNKVPRSDGARPLMQLPDSFPSDLNHAWYVKEARSILQDIGFARGLV